MFDFAWSEIALIGIVALVAIGPKDLPVAIKAVAGMIKKARRMAAEFQTHVDELVKEADLQEVRDQFNQIRRFDFRGEIEKAVDSDGTIRSTLSSNPLAEPFKPITPPPSEPTPHTDTADQETTRVLERPAQTILHPDTPAFIPPASIPPDKSISEPPPAFIPPDYAGIKAADTPKPS